jgi:spermidine synthase
MHAHAELPAAPVPAARGRTAASLKIVVAVSGAVLMALEILGSRVLAPSYGSSVYVWGSLISTFLVALAVGYALGGRIADRRPSLAALSVVLALAAVLMLPSIVWADGLLKLIGGLAWDARWSALAAAIVLFLPPSLAMGMVTPFAVRIGIQRMESAGTVSGGYSALSTAGSIAGTLAATFFLIPVFPVDALLIGLAATLVLCAWILVRDRTSAAVAFLGALSLAAAILVRVPPAPVGGEKVLVRKDTPYHHIVVTQLDTSRWMRFDTLTQSGVNLAHPDRSVVGYDEALLASLAFRPGIRRVCVIGLGGGSFSRAFARMRPEAEIDTVEIDPVVRDLALEYFLYRESERVRTVIADGRVFLAQPGPAYDLIVLDAFNSTGVPFHLTTREFFVTLRRRLSPDGIFAANFVGQLMGEDGRLFWATYKTIRRQFGQVYVASPHIMAGRPPSSGNLIVYATVSADPQELDGVRLRAAELARRWKLRNADHYLSSLVHAPQPPDNIPELTDAYAPVEALQNF